MNNTMGSAGKGYLQWAHGIDYHSAYWALLVETGWITHEVNEGVATMVKPAYYRQPYYL